MHPGSAGWPSGNRSALPAIRHKGVSGWPCCTAAKAPDNRPCLSRSGTARSHTGNTQNGSVHFPPAPIPLPPGTAEIPRGKAGRFPTGCFPWPLDLSGLWLPGTASLSPRCPSAPGNLNENNTGPWLPGCIALRGILLRR